MASTCCKNVAGGRFPYRGVIVSSVYYPPLISLSSPPLYFKLIKGSHGVVVLDILSKEIITFHHDYFKEDMLLLFQIFL